jgi:DNA-binding CsgD family transcriptional regulator
MTDSGTTGLIGRSQLLEQVARLLAARRPVLLIGPGGVGKTSVLAGTADRCGVRAFHGGGLELTAELAYVAVGRALDRLDLSGEPAAVAEVVYRSVGQGLLLVDDLHLADAASLAVVELLARRVAAASICRAREAAPGNGSGDSPGGTSGRTAAPLGLVGSLQVGSEGLVGRLVEAGFVVVEVPPLKTEDSRSLALRVNPAIGGGALRQVVSRARGIPRLVEELARSGLVTDRERQVLVLVAQGLSNAEISRRLGIGRPTVRRLLESARGKLGAPNRVAAAIRLFGEDSADQLVIGWVGES